jgi:hypothetical protein
VDPLGNSTVHEPLHYSIFSSRVRAEGSRFWYTSLEELEEVPVPDGVPSLRTRVIEFTGKFEPVQWACRAPLPSGKLCPRQDRYKVFTHIILRQETIRTSTAKHGHYLQC